MKKLLALLFFCLAALTPAAFAEEGGALLTLKVNNIQVHAKWGVTPKNFSIDNGELRYEGGLSVPQTVTVIITAEDNFKALNESYVNLTAVATVNIALSPSPNQKTIFVMGGYSDLNNTALKDVWSSTDGKTWTKSTPGWSGRQGLQVVKHNSKIYVLGGVEAPTGTFPNIISKLLNDVWSSTDGQNWMQVNMSAGWTPRNAHQAVVHNGRIYVVGDGASKNDVWSSADGMTWSVETLNADWPARRNYRVVSHRGTMYMMGGRGPISSADPYKNDVWSSTDGKSWDKVGNADWSGRSRHQAVVHDNKIYVLGGLTFDGVENDVWFSADGKTWEEAKGIKWQKRDNHQVVSHDGLLYLLGGVINSIRRDDVWSSSDGRNWVKVINAAWRGRANFGAVVFP